MRYSEGSHGRRRLFAQGRGVQTKGVSREMHEPSGAHLPSLSRDCLVHSHVRFPGWCLENIHVCVCGHLRKKREWSHVRLDGVATSGQQ